MFRIPFVYCILDLRLSKLELKCSDFCRSRFEYGIYLLNKNLSQLRWQCSLVTADLRPILRNVAELMALGESLKTLTDADVEALPKVKTLTSPPKSIEHQVCWQNLKLYMMHSLVLKIKGEGTGGYRTSFRLGFFEEGGFIMLVLDHSCVVASFVDEIGFLEFKYWTIIFWRIPKEYLN